MVENFSRFLSIINYRSLDFFSSQISSYSLSLFLPFLSFSKELEISLASVSIIFNSIIHSREHTSKKKPTQDLFDPKIDRIVGKRTYGWAMRLDPRLDSGDRWMDSPVLKRRVNPSKMARRSFDIGGGGAYLFLRSLVVVRALARFIYIT